MPSDSRCVNVSGSVFGNLHCSWVIPKFSFIETDKRIESEYFQLQAFSPRWCLRIRIQESESPHFVMQDDNYISCHLQLVNSKIKNNGMLVRAASYSFRNNADKVLWSAKPTKWHVLEEGTTLGFEETLKRKTLMKDLIDDVLIICVSLSYCNTCVKDGTSTKYIAEMSPIATLLQSYQSLSLSEANADITIFVGKNKIPVHSAILSSRSKVFQAMFQNEMKEKKNRSVQITDFEKDVIDALIQFMYTGDVRDMDSSVALQLLRASDKYDMEDLVLYCSNYLMSNLNEENVIRVLIKADMYNAHYLKLKSLEYLGKCRGREIIKKHRALLKKHPDILLDILEADRDDDS